MAPSLFRKEETNNPAPKRMLQQQLYISPIRNIIPSNCTLAGRTKISTHQFPHRRNLFVWGGEGGIRTLGNLRYTRFPIVHLRPLGHLSLIVCIHGNVEQSQLTVRCIPRSLLLNSMYTRKLDHQTQSHNCSMS